MLNKWMNVLIRHQNLFQDHKLVYKNKQLNVLMELKKRQTEFTPCIICSVTPLLVFWSVVVPVRVRYGPSRETAQN